MINLLPFSVTNFKMSFYLVKDAVVNFPKGYVLDDDNISKNIRIASKVVRKYECPLEKNFLPTLANLPVKISLEGFTPRHLHFGEINGERKYSGTTIFQWFNIELDDGIGSKGVLLKIRKRFPEAEVKISISDIKDRTCPLACSKISFGWQKIEIKKQLCRSIGFPKQVKVLKLGHLSGTTLAHCIKPLHRDNSFTGKVTIAVKVSSHNCIGQRLHQQISLSQKILEEGLGADVVITAGNGAQIRAHKCFLSAQSPVLRAMLASGMQEGRTGNVTMDDMSEEALKAFVDYLYVGNRPEVSYSCQLAYELLRAGNKYHVQSLEELMKCVLMNMGAENFTIDLGLQIFGFVRCLDGAEQLKLKVANVLKSKVGVLKHSVPYKNLFKEHPEAAMELCTCFGQIR